MNIETTLKIVYAIVAFLAAAIPLVIALFANIKSRLRISKRLATTIDDAERAKLEAAKAAAINDMHNVCDVLIANVETLYEGVANILKKEGKNAGPVKKDSVMSKLQAYALERGYAFDAEFWNTKIDEIVELTRKVNVSK